jgi:hypothetical protein
MSSCTRGDSRIDKTLTVGCDRRIIANTYLTGQPVCIFDYPLNRLTCLGLEPTPFLGTDQHASLFRFDPSIPFSASAKTHAMQVVAAGR